MRIKLVNINVSKMKGRRLGKNLCLIYKKRRTKLNKTTANNDTSNTCQTVIPSCPKSVTTHYLSQSSILVE